jgi:dUTP pyrophosphatase
MSKRITILNSPGTIDSGYRGELFIRISARPGQITFISRGMRIAQAVLSPVYRANLERISEISTDTTRGEGKFGSTGA